LDKLDWVEALDVVLEGRGDLDCFGESFGETLGLDEVVAPNIGELCRLSSFKPCLAVSCLVSVLPLMRRKKPGKLDEGTVS
jgi:hypothetical protein